MKNMGEKNLLVIANPMFIHASFHPFPDLYIRFMLCFQYSEFQESLCLLRGFNFFNCPVNFFLTNFLIFYTVPHLNFTKTIVDILSSFSLSCCSFFCVLLYILKPSITVSHWLFSFHTDVLSLSMSSLRAKLYYIWICVNWSFSLKINKPLKCMILWSLLLLQVS